MADAREPSKNYNYSRGGGGGGGGLPTTCGYFWVRAPNVAYVATGGKKWLNGMRWSLNMFTIGLVSMS